MLSDETTQFIEELAANNNRDWFKANEPRYKQHYKLAGEAFGEMLAVHLGEALDTQLTPRNFRIFRDVRFSKDKTPYNPHLRIGLSATGGPPDRPFLMMGLQLGKLVIGAGRMGFQKPTVERFREAVAGDDGQELAAMLDDLCNAGVRLGKPDLKRVPAPYDKDHPRAELLKYKGLTVWRDFDGHQLAYGDQGAANVAHALIELRPVYDWIMDLSRS